MFVWRVLGIFKTASFLSRCFFNALHSYIMDEGSTGCELIVAGKARGARAKTMKFKDGYMVRSGNASRSYIDTATRHINLKQGVLGIKVCNSPRELLFGLFAKISMVV